MALIENLERDNWRSFLKSCFEQAVELLATDRFRWAGSSIDDLKSWLAAGGVNRVKYHQTAKLIDFIGSSYQPVSAGSLSYVHIRCLQQYVVEIAFLDLLEKILFIDIDDLDVLMAIATTKS